MRSVLLTVRVIPRAGRAGLAGTRDGAILIRLNAPPVDGAANAELVNLLSDLLDVPRRAITIESGERSRTKRVRVDGMDTASLETKITALLDSRRT